MTAPDIWTKFGPNPPSARSLLWIIFYRMFDFGHDYYLELMRVACFVCG